MTPKMYRWRAGGQVVSDDMHERNMQEPVSLDWWKKYPFFKKFKLCIDMLDSHVVKMAFVLMEHLKPIMCLFCLICLHAIKMMGIGANRHASSKHEIVLREEYWLGFYLLNLFVFNFGIGLKYHRMRADYCGSSSADPSGNSGLFLLD